MNILIIKQNEDFCEMLTNFLTLEGHNSHCVSSGKEVFDAIEAIHPDLVIIEISMPEILAIEIVKSLQIRSATRSIPVIVISDFSELEIELLHVFDFIHKPLDLVRLRENLVMLAKGRQNIRDSYFIKADELSTEEHLMFHDFLITHSGLHFEKRNIKMLERGLLNRMAALRISSFSDYYQFIINNMESRSELQKLLQFLIVGETFFFRYHAHFSALAKNMLPPSLNPGDQKPHRFWSAGCSTGEEPYSMAITVMECFPDWKKRDIRIIATDINNRALKTAQEGVYSSGKIRVTEQKYLDKYFKQIGKSYVVRDEVKSLVEFSHVNLQTLQIDHPALHGGDMDAIFCRNVMIYFNTETTRKVVDTFSSSLRPGGALFLGHAETLANISTDFDQHFHEGSFFFTKKTEPRSLPLIALPYRLQVNKANLSQKSVPDISKTLTLLSKTPSFFPETTMTADIQELYVQGTALLEEKQFEPAKQLFNQILEREQSHTGAILAIGLIMVNRGKLEDALERYNQVIAINDLLPEAYYLRGLLYEMTDREYDAIHEYRKAVLLKMDFVMPHYQLGKLYFRLGQQKFGVRELKNSLKILEKSGRETIVPYSGAISRDIFLVQVRKEMISVDEKMAA